MSKITYTCNGKIYSDNTNSNMTRANAILIALFAITGILLTGILILATIV